MLSGALLALLASLLMGCAASLGSAEGWAAPAELPGGLVLVQERSGELVALDLSGGSASVAWRYPDDIGLPASVEDDDIDLEALYAEPIVDGNVLYLAGFSGNLVALDLEGDRDPSLRWVARIRGGLVGTPLLDEARSRLLVPTERGELLPVSTGDGTVSASLIDGGERYWSAPVSAGAMVLVTGLDRHVRAVDVATDEEVWAVELDGAVAGDPLLDGDTLYVGALDRTLYALDGSASGDERWDVRGDGWFWAQPLLSGDTIYAATADGSVYALDAAGGDERWRFHEDDSEIRARPLLVGGVLVVAARDAVLWGLDPASGEIRWSEELEDVGDLLADGLVLESSILYSSTRGTLLSVDPLTGDITTLYERD